MKLPQVSMIVAMTPEGVIGNKGKMPWRLPRDMKRFVHYTSGAAVVMGPKTYASLPKENRPLKGRLNIVLTTDRDYSPEPGVLVAHDPRQALELAATRGFLEFCVIGGATVYTSFLKVAEILRITYVNARIKGDTLFPHWDKRDWYQVWEEKKEWTKEKGDKYPTHFAEWRRKVPPEPEGTPRSWSHRDKKEWDKKKDLPVGGVIAYKKRAAKKSLPGKTRKKKGVRR